MAEPPFKQLRLSNFFCSVRNDMSNANDRHDQNDSTSNRIIGRVILEIAVLSMRRHRQQKACFWKVRLPRPHPHQLRQAIVQVSVTSPQHLLALDWLFGNLRSAEHVSDFELRQCLENR